MIKRNLLLTVCAVAGLTVLSGVTSAETGGACKIQVNSEPSSATRTVLLAGGNAWDLFQKYLSEAERNRIKLSLWGGVKVVANDGKGRKEYTVDRMEMLSMEGSKERWKKKLAGVTSQLDPAALNEAERLKWDVVCIGPLPTGNQAGKGVTASQQDISLEARQHFQQGMQYAARRDFSNAVREFSNAINYCPSYAGAFSNRGVAYMQQKKFDLAEDDLKKAVQLGPTDGKNHYNLACWYSLQHQVGRGLAAIDTALGNGFADYNALRKDKDLANLRKNPDWQKTLEKHKVFLGSGN